jgi:hypothetical protein
MHIYMYIYIYIYINIYIGENSKELSASKVPPAKPVKLAKKNSISTPLEVKLPVEDVSGMDLDMYGCMYIYKNMYIYTYIYIYIYTCIYIYICTYIYVFLNT